VVDARSASSSQKDTKAAIEMTSVMLFRSTVGDGPARLTIAVAQTFDALDPFVVTLGSDSWPLATQDAERLAAAGRRIEGRLDYCAQRNEPVEEAPFFRRQLGNADGRVSTLEQGIDTSGPIAAVYIEWNGRRIVDSTGRLLRALAVLGEAAATIRQTTASRRTQDIRIDPQTFRSPYGWDGRAPWET
jgi:hypothetical protein